MELMKATNHSAWHTVIVLLPIVPLDRASIVNCNRVTLKKVIHITVTQALLAHLHDQEEGLHEAGLELAAFHREWFPPNHSDPQDDRGAQAQELRQKRIQHKETDGNQRPLPSHQHHLKQVPDTHHIRSQAEWKNVCRRGNESVSPMLRRVVTGCQYQRCQRFLTTTTLPPNDDSKPQHQQPEQQHVWVMKGRQSTARAHGLTLTKPTVFY